MPICINLETVYNIKGSVFVGFRYNTPLVFVLSMGLTPSQVFKFCFLAVYFIAIADVTKNG